MSVIQSMAQARKERLQRIAARAVPQGGAPARPAEMAERVRPPSLPDSDYERAWAAVILGDGDRFARRPRVVDILRATARQFAITSDEMLAEGRSRSLSRPRHVAMYLAKRLTTKSFAEIGRTCGGRDHTTVVHAVSSIEARLASDAELAHHVACIREKLEDLHTGKSEDQS